MRSKGRGRGSRAAPISTRRDLQHCCREHRLSLQRRFPPPRPSASISAAVISAYGRAKVARNKKKRPSGRSSAGERRRGLPLPAKDGYNDRGRSGDDEVGARMGKKGLNPSSTLAASPPLSSLTASSFRTIVWRPPSPRSGQPSTTAVFASSDVVVTKLANCAATVLSFLPSAQALVSSGP
uniref:Uncharacterized protein n=1 Tax=Oryza meridionalis TaxID=40149 RepID=A0A0E0CLL3_9ORYZ